MDDRKTSLRRQPLRQRMSASTLLSLFKARPSPSSVSQMDRSPKLTRAMPVLSTYHGDSDHANDLGRIRTLELPSFTSSPSPLDTRPEASRAHSDDSALSNIDVTPIPHSNQLDAQVSDTPVRVLPARSARSRVSYASPKRTPHTTPKEKKTRTEQILQSDTLGELKQSKSGGDAKAVVKPDTARGRVREEIATMTKAKRDAYLLYHQEYFLPLLPNTNYLTKLAQSGIMQSISPHQQLQVQPEK